MAMQLYSIKDVVAQEFGPVFQAKNDGVAIRQVNNTFKTMPPGDADAFHLFKIGEFDTETGLLMRLDAPEKINWYFVAPVEGKE